MNFLVHCGYFSVFSFQGALSEVPFPFPFSSLPIIPSGIEPVRQSEWFKKKQDARQPPIFPGPFAQVLSAGEVFTVVFGMGTGVSPLRITTGQILLSALSKECNS